MSAFSFQAISADDQEAASFARLRDYLRDYIARYSPYYRRLFERNAIDISSISTYADFQRLIPITTKKDLVNNLAEFVLAPRTRDAVSGDTEPLPEGDWNRYLAARTIELSPFAPRTAAAIQQAAFDEEWTPIHFQSSGGSTGVAATTCYTYRDLDLQFRRSGSWWYDLPGSVQRGEKWLNLLPAAPHLAIYAGMLLPLLNSQPNVNMFGGRVIPTERQVEMALRGKCNHVLAIPSYLMHWLRTAKSMIAEGKIQPIESFKSAICVGEPLTEPYRVALKTLFAEVGSPSVTVLQGMSSTELRTGGFYECAEGSGLHLDPEFFYTEILDPETKEPVRNGEPGVLVWSHIDWRGTAILRYWSGDYVAGGVTSGQCPHCGFTMPRLMTPIWRSEFDFTKFRGSRLEYIPLMDCIRGVEGIRSFQIVFGKIDQEDRYSRDTLTIHVALEEGARETSVERHLRDAVMRGFEVTVDEIAFDDPAAVEARLFAKKLKAEWILDQRGDPA